MRLPDPIANTTTEAYLAYKAGVLAEGDLKPKLYEPYIHLDAWLAYWAGLVATYPVDKNNDPEMLTDEEAYIAYLSGVTNTYPEEFRDPADIRVAAYLRYLISARWGRPEYPVTNEELYLSMLKAQYIPSGDPSSDIVIDGTAKAPFVDVKMYGDTFQQSYEGKNLFPVAQRQSQTKSGITLTINDDGSFDISGTSTANTNFDFIMPLSQSGIVGGASYTISSNRPVGDVRYYVHSCEQGGAWRKTLIAFIQDGTLTAAEPTTDYINFVINVQQGVSVSLSGVKTMIEVGSTATPFEPYVGGVPAPNPDYPQPIQTVTGRQMVKVEGKNLLDVESNLSSSSYGLDFSYSDNEIVVSGTPTTTYANATKKIPTFLSAGQYTLSLNKVLEHRVYLWVEYVDGATASTAIIAPGSSYATVTFAKDVVTMRLDFSALTPDVAISESVSVQLEKGSTATAYEPYSSNDYEINLGKNLFNKNDVVNGIPSASDGNITSTSSVSRTSDYIPVSPNTTYSHTGHPLGWATITWYKSDKSFIQRTGNVTTTTSPNEAAYARVSCALGNLDTCQFEAGGPTDYAPYFTPIELCKLGTYQDYIWKDGDDWKVHKATSGNMTLNGSEDGWSKGNNGRFNLSDYAPSPASGSADNNPILSNRFISRFSFDDLSVFLSGTNELVCFIYTSASTLTEWKAWLSSNNTTVCYALATPTDTTITDQTLIAQLEALVAGGAENGTTYIKVSASDPNLPGLLYVEAPKYD